MNTRQLSSKRLGARQPFADSLHGVKLQCKCARGGTQRKARNSDLGIWGGGSFPPIVHEVLRSPGQPLDAGTRAFMEPRFGHNFSQVRVHTDSRAEASAQAIIAQPYTEGPDMVFGPGRYALGIAGRRLLAHELTHVLHQTGARSSCPPIALAETNDGSEREARQAEQAILSGSPDYWVQSHVPPRMQGDALRGADDRQAGQGPGEMDFA